MIKEACSGDFELSIGVRLGLANARTATKKWVFLQEMFWPDVWRSPRGRVRLGIGDLARVCTARSLLCFVGRDEKKLDGAVAEIRAVGGQAIAVRADVREYAQVEHAVETAVEKFGALDILVNSAAGNFFCPSAELSPNGWRTVVDIDLNGTFLICPCARGNRSLLS
jgi:hypothetical protein